MHGAFCTWRTSPGKVTAGISRQVEPRCSPGPYGEGEREKMEKESRRHHLQGSPSGGNLRLPSQLPCLRLRLKVVYGRGGTGTLLSQGRGRGRILLPSCCCPTRVCREDKTGGRGASASLPRVENDGEVALQPRVLWHLLFALKIRRWPGLAPALPRRSEASGISLGCFKVSGGARAPSSTRTPSGTVLRSEPQLPSPDQGTVLEPKVTNAGGAGKEGRARERGTAAGLAPLI